MHMTIKLRLYDRHAKKLARQSQAVNIVWNYCNETQMKAVKAGRRWISAFELQRLTSGSSKELNLHSHTIGRVCAVYDRCRRQQRKPWLRWRGRQALGWVPFNTSYVAFDGNGFIFRGELYRPMHLHDCLKPGMRFGAGSFNADAKGHSYINVPVEIEATKPNVVRAVGVDLGLKTLATLSDGNKVEMPRFYRESEQALATAHRARKTKRTRAIHAKARNRRKDFLHKASAALCANYGTIIVGDVSPSKLAKTRMAKSIYDAGWAGFKQMLSYKSIRNGGRFVEVSEAYSTQTCSMCGCLPASRPKGIAGLRIREWACDDCGTVNDRDVNAARNILRVGLDALVAGAPPLAGSSQFSALLGGT